METAAIVLVLKTPFLTAVFFWRAGARGGMLTPALATGAAAGTPVGADHQCGGRNSISCSGSLNGPARQGVLAITQRAAVFGAAIFVWELARPPLWLLLVFPGRRLERLRLAASRRAWPGLEARVASQ